MAFVVSTEADVTDEDRRARVYSGEVFCIPPRDTISAFSEFAWTLIQEAFGDFDPSTAHTLLPVEEYVKILGPLKTGFTHSPRSKELLRRRDGRFRCRPRPDVLRRAEAARRSAGVVPHRRAGLQLHAAPGHLVLRPAEPEQLVGAHSRRHRQVRAWRFTPSTGSGQRSTPARTSMPTNGIGRHAVMPRCTSRKIRGRTPD